MVFKKKSEKIISEIISKNLNFKTNLYFYFWYPNQVWLESDSGAPTRILHIQKLQKPGSSDDSSR
jgi:hypothetical protein